MGKLQFELGRVIRARGSWLVCVLLLASTLVTGCNGTGAAGNSAAVASTGPAKSISGRPSRTGPTSGSPPATAHESVDVTWTAPTTNTNGTALTNLAGYTIHYGTSRSALIQSVNVQNAGATDYVVQGLTGGTWYFAVTSYTNSGLQSNYSTVVSTTIS